MAGLDAGELDLDTAHERASDALGEAEQRLERLLAEEQAAERDRVSLLARKEALELGLRRKDGAAALLAAGHELSGLLGSVAALLQVEPGWQTAVAAAMGAAADAVAVDDIASAAAAVRHLRDEDGGRAALLVSGAAPHRGPRGLAGAARPAPRTRSMWSQAPAELEAALAHLLARVALSPRPRSARSISPSRIPIFGWPPGTVTWSRPAS